MVLLEESTEKISKERQRFANRLECGGVTINGGTYTDNGVVPFGGNKHSGWGRENGREQIENLTVSQTVYVYPEGRTLGQ
eukprot:UN15364